VANKKDHTLFFFQIEGGNERLYIFIGLPKGQGLTVDNLIVLQLHYSLFSKSALNY
jgi:hypothetical protein